MKIIFLSILFVFISACEAPRSVKMRNSETDRFAQECDRNVYNCDRVGDDGSNGDNGDSTGDNGDNGGDNIVVPNDASHCSWSNDGITGFTSEHGVVGKYTVCKGQLNPKKFYFQVGTPTSGSKICFIPLTRVGADRDTTYLGNPHCDYFPKTDSIYELNFTLNRIPNGETSSSVSIDAFIILKDDTSYYASPFPYYVNNYGNLQYQSGGVIRHYEAYYGCINALEVYGQSNYCTQFTSVGKFINHEMF